MKKIAITILFLSSLLLSQTQFTSFLNHINSLPDSLKTAAVDSFMTYARSLGIPFIEGNSASFIYRGTASSLSVAGDFNGWSATTDAMLKLAGTNFWYKTKTFEPDARLDYKFVRNGSTWILDPENPNTCNGGFGPNSELAMPGYIQPWEINYKYGIQHGTVEVRSLFSTNTNSTYLIKIYLPPGYNSSGSTRYPAAYFQDGYEYVDLASAVNVLDNLIDSNKIQKVIGIFVRPNNRNEEYAFSLRNAYRLFFVNELLPFIDSLYNTIPLPSQRTVIGDSYGANISALICYNHPEAFGNCGLHSAAFQPNNYEAYSLIAGGPKKDIRFASVWGTYESLYTNMRNFRSALQTKGYDLFWKELPEGHSWGLWRATIDDMLRFFYPPLPSDVKDNEQIPSTGFFLSENYPNPFNPVTVINYQLPSGGDVTLKVFDILGNEVATLVNEFKKAGSYSVSFDASRLSSGTYFYRLSVGGLVLTNKMVLIR